jgi:beta-lactamase class A
MIRRRLGRAALVGLASLALLTGCGRSPINARPASAGTRGTTTTRPAPATTAPSGPPTSDNAPPATTVPSTASPSTTSAPPLRRPSPLAGVAGLLAGRSGQVTVAVYDRLTRQTWVLRQDRLEDTASIVKLEIMGALLRDQQQGELTLTPSDHALMTAMIEQSDNDAATDLWDLGGGAADIESFDRRIGMEQTTPSTEVLIPGTTLPGWGLTTTTASDQLRIVETFAFPNPYLDRASRLYGLSLMERVEPGQNWGVSAGSAAGVTVALKNGWLPLTGQGWQVNSVGWIDGAGRDYVLAVLGVGSPSEQYGIDTIQAISESVYDHLG